MNPVLLKKYNWWLIAAVLFFIIWKLFLVAWMWHGRAVPPEPDDTLLYSGYIYSVSNCPHFICNPPLLPFSQPNGYYYLSYRIAWGVVARLLHVSSTTMLAISFYAGTVALVGALYWFLWQWLPGTPRQQAFTLAVLALYAGQPGFHGFFWVVPSFFSVLLFFVLLGFISRKHANSYWLIILTSVTFILVHPMSFYALAIFPLYAAIRLALEQKWQPALYRSIALILIAGVLTQTAVVTSTHFVIQALHLAPSAAPPTTSSSGSFNLMVVNTRTTEAAVTVSSIQHIHDDYVNWVFPHWSGFLLFLFFVFLLWRYRFTTTLALLVACFLFTVLSCLVNPFGYRSLVYLWPVTFLFYGVGFWCAFQFCHDHIKKNMWRYMLYSLTSLILAGFIGANLLFSFLLADFMNHSHNPNLGTAFITYLETHTSGNEPIVFRDKLLAAYSLNTPLATHPSSTIAGQTKYFVNYFPATELKQQTALDSFYASATHLFTGRSISSHASSSLPAVIPSPDPGLQLEQRFGDVFIYRNEFYKP